MSVATVVGALGAHALKGTITPEQISTLLTAVQYQFLHALGLLIIGIMALQVKSRGLNAAGGLILGGIVLFSGSLYLLVCGAPRWVGVLTPIGGTCQIAGWCVAAVALWRAVGVVR